MKTQEMNISFEKAFLPMPEEARFGVEEAFERGEKEMKKKHKILSLLSVAAALTLVFAVTALAAGGLGTPKPDKIALSAGESLPAAESEATPAPVRTNMPDPVFEPDFTHIDPFGENALWELLDIAYRDFCQLSGSEVDSRAVDSAANALRSIPDDFGADTANWPEPICEILKAELGLSDEYIEENCLTNYICACLSCLDGAEASEVNVNVEYSELTGETAYFTGSYLPSDAVQEVQYVLK